MSNTFSGQTGHFDDAEHLRSFWTHIFSDGIARNRKAAGRSIEETAELAGMAVSEWMALESGVLLPQTSEQLRSMAGALLIDYTQLANFVLLCWSAWEQ